VSSIFCQCGRQAAQVKTAQLVFKIELVSKLLSLTEAFACEISGFAQLSMFWNYYASVTFLGFCPQNLISFMIAVTGGCN
jgi:hypothetical protein